MENMQCTIVKACAPVIDIEVGVLPSHSVSLHFILLPALRKFGNHSKQRIMLKALLLALHISETHTEAITRVPQIVTYAVAKGESKGEQR